MSLSSRMRPSSFIGGVGLIVVVLSFAGCGKKAPAPSSANLPTTITVTQVKTQPVRATEAVVGEIAASSAPTVAAQVAGQVRQTLVDEGQQVKRGQLLAVIDPKDLALAAQMPAADVRRIEALIANQQRLTDRYRQLIKENFVSPMKLEEAESQLKALRAQLAAAKSQVGDAQLNLSRTRVTAPLAGRIEQRFVTAGDYVTPGKPLFQIAGADDLEIHLRFPETTAPRIRPGVKVLLRASGGTAVAEGVIKDVKPMVDKQSRAFEAIVDIPNPGGWKPGASVDAEVVFEERGNARVVPEASVVVRPAGNVVYVIANKTARQRIVTTGVTQNGMTEILSGLRVGETVAVDGAGFLTDGAPVALSSARG